MIRGPSEPELRQGHRVREPDRRRVEGSYRHGELTADHTEKKFAVNVEFWEKDSGGDTNAPTLVVNVVSACYQVPEGEEVDRY
ncbi:MULTISPECIES: hypothetical protein [unclassified Streptomyces]|uniref:hypothetical protein n=1 Tax=unclassified Streptomyces TaxID=2593676 RepID=UPI0004CB2C8C|nr:MULTISPECIES: hypothetical protein [unclassified Streptomyces]